MLSLRRRDFAPRMEIMPLIDVIFLLLTFFIYAMVLMVRAELLPMELQAFTAATPARPQPAATISLRRDGTLYLDRRPMAPDSIGAALLERRAADPETVIYLALEEGEGDVDRGPILTDLWDRLKNLGLEINLVGRPGEGGD